MLKNIFSVSTTPLVAVMTTINIYEKELGWAVLFAILLGINIAIDLSKEMNR